jgi:hypothetical protein
MQAAAPSPSFHPSMLCWICGKSPSFDDRHKDEHGHLVHKKCYELRLQLRNYDSKSKPE